MSTNNVYFKENHRKLLLNYLELCEKKKKKKKKNIRQRAESNNEKLHVHVLYLISGLIVLKCLRF